VGTALVGTSLGLGACSGQGSDPPPLAGTFPLPTEAKSSLERSLTLARFRGLLGTTFLVEDGKGGRHELALGTIRERGAPIRSPKPAGESFTLLFESAPSRGTALGQDTYRTSHPALGTFSLFLVPRQSASAPDEPLRYAATFSHV
jgi:uncharacterized protein DUF6916